MSKHISISTAEASGGINMGNDALASAIPAKLKKRIGVPRDIDVDVEKHVAPCKSSGWPSRLERDRYCLSLQ